MCKGKELAPVLSQRERADEILFSGLVTFSNLESTRKNLTILGGPDCKIQTGTLHVNDDGLIFAAQ